MDAPERLLDLLVTNDQGLRLLARRLTADAGAEDDALQDALSKAWEKPPRVESLVAWLRRVARNAALVRRRDDDRRRTREREYVRNRDEVVPSAADAVERQEHRDLVSRAVRALDEPYRSAILLRFFENLPPRAIAAERGVPVATVKSWIRRGLEQLRATLDHHFGDDRDWRMALTPLAAPVSTMGTVTASPTIGVIVMSTKLKTAAGIAITAALVAAIMLARMEPPPRDQGEKRSDERTPEAAAAPAPPGVEAPPAKAVTNTEHSPAAAAVDATKSAPHAAAVIRGRCVAAESGAPIAGSVIRLEPTEDRNGPFGRASRRAEDDVVNRRPSTWTPLNAVSSGADGYFTLRLPKALDTPVTLVVRDRGRATMRRAWPRIDARADIDIGDVPLVRGHRFRGRVVDEIGRAEPGVRLTVNLATKAPASLLASRRHFWIEATRDGSFELPEPIVSGTWSVRPFGRQLSKGHEVRVAIPASPDSIEVVLQSRNAITGTVRREDGTPVVGAHVSIDRELAPRMILSNREGHFRIEREPEMPDGPCPLYVEKDGFEPWQMAAAAWGTAGVRVTLREGLPLDVRVTDAATGDAVEHFGLRCFPVPPLMFDPDGGRHLRLAGRHAGGVARLDSVRRGPNVVLVEPLGPDYAPSAFRRIDVGGTAPVELNVAVSRRVERRLRVRRANGIAVSGTRVELVRTPLAGSVDLDSEVGPASRLRASIPHERFALLLGTGATDAEGILALSGPANESLVLRLLGPGHPPFVVRDVQLGRGTGVLDVVVPTGATIIGRLGPLDVLRALGPGKNAIARSRRQASPGARRATLDRYRPGIRLIEHGKRPVGLGQAGFEDKVLPDANGRFRFTGVRPGSWDLYLSIALDQAGGQVSPCNHRIATLRDLRLGEVRELDFNLGYWRAGTLSGSVLYRGRPLAGRFVSFRGTRIDERGESVRAPTRSTRTDREGRFRVRLFPGVYRAAVSFPQVGKTNATRLESGEEVDVGPGVQIEQTFRLSGARLELRVVAPDGKTPVRGLRLRARIEGWVTIRLGPTDARGVVTIDPAPPGRIEFRAFPRGFQSPIARRAARRSGKRIKSFVAGEATVPPGERAIVRTLVLPAASGY